MGGGPHRPPPDARNVIARGNGTGIQRFVRERERMVEEQLVARGVTDPRVLEAMRRVPRHVFVEEALAEQAYGDHPLPIGEGQTISQPFIVGKMTELLGLTGKEKVLEIGTGSGYQAAVLGELAARVCTVERVPKLAQRAREILEMLGYANVWVRVANGTLGWPDEAPFDRILVAAGGPSVPPPLFAQLAEGGRLVMPVGDALTQVLHVVDKHEGEMQTTRDAGCVFVKLVGKYAWGA
jgi:protein-L-isoaspartate(D-aspartate) O-methyltransferase